MCQIWTSGNQKIFAQHYSVWNYFVSNWYLKLQFLRRTVCVTAGGRKTVMDGCCLIESSSVLQLASTLRKAKVL